ncbi:MAG: RNA polymerase factor sigma-54 [Bacteroidetes bacterium]|nr:RNA polymerase factor sigma-54 [Bacteroidota bacterium]
MLKQSLNQKLLQKLSPQQIQLMKLLQLPTIALEQRIKEEIESNPALEDLSDSDDNEKEESNADDLDPEGESRDDFDLSEYISDDDEPSYKYEANNHSKDDEEREIPLSMGQSFQEMLLTQLGLQNIDDHKYLVAEYLVGNLDESGYLSRDLASIVDDMAFYQSITTTEKELEELLVILQSLDPPGIGARNLQECLLLQIKRKKRATPSIVLAEMLLDKYFDEFSKRHFDKILKKLEITEDSLKGAVAEILKLNPKPGNSAGDSSRTAQAVVPDFVLINNDGELDLQLNARNAPELKISKMFSEMLKAYSSNKTGADREQKEAVMFVKQKLDSAKWFIDAIKQRQNTLLFTMRAIIEYQHEYFLTGDETKLKPMILKDIAEKVGIDISTVSRVANSKYIQTPFGTLLIKSFFSESLQNDSGEEVSTKEIKKILEECVTAEDKKSPYTDDELMKVLKTKGYNIARRTVAKYREQLNIPVGRLRKEI